MRKLKVAYVMTHPVQYFAPWARAMTRDCRDIDLTVVYATEPTAEQQGTGFGRAFQWDVPLRDGYHSIVVRPVAEGISVDSDNFWSLDVPEITDTVTRLRPDVGVIAGWHSVTQIRALRAFRRLNVPVLYRGDSHLESAATGWRRHVSRVRARRLLQQFDAHLVVGTRAREYLRYMGVADPCLFDSPHAVDNEFFASADRAAVRASARAEWGVSSDTFVVLLAGKLVEKKRPIDVVRAAGRIGGRVALVVAGDGPLADAVRAEAARLNVPLIGPRFLNQSQMVAAYAGVDCLALASDWTETWGLVVNEALVAGVPVVVSDRVGCAPDLVVADRTGYVFPFGDAEQLAARLIRVRDRLSAGQPFANACQEHVSRWSFTHATAGLLAAARAVTLNRVPVQTAATARIVVPAGHMVAPGGMEHMTFLVLRTLIEQGASVHCLLNRWDSYRMARLATDAGASWSVGYYWYPLAKRPGLIQAAQIVWDILRCSVDLSRAALSQRATHIFCPEELSILRHAPALALARTFGIPVILRQPTAPSTTRMSRVLWRHVISRLATRIVANSAFTRRQLRDAGAPAERIDVIRNVRPSTDNAGPVAVRDPHRVVYVGQIIPGKGLHVLLEAIALLRARGVTATLDVAGRLNGWAPPELQSYRAQIAERAAQVDLKGSVRLLGWRDDVLQLMAAAAVHAAPSLPELREAFGVVVLDAKAASIPSVVFASGALPELIRHQVDGWVCGEATAAALADGLEYFLRNRHAAETAGQAAHESLANFDRDAFRAAWASQIGLPHVKEPVSAPKHMTVEGR